MTSIIKRVLVLAALAVIALAATASSAGAATGILLRPGRAIEQVSQGLVTFRTGEVTASCRLTLRGTLPTTAQTIRGEETRIGEITGARWSECRGGEIGAVANLNWPMTLTNLNEEEPPKIRIEVAIRFEIRIEIAIRFSVLGPFTNCGYGGIAEGVPMAGSLRRTGGANEYTSGPIEILTNTLSRHEGALCPASMSLSGTFEPPRPTQTITLS
jgi:hypothetical protein